uniref:Bestrophin homolog n=1 Tax=Buteo japonicus TaxID=224669 RepID=A0A8C0BSA6_9AVES
ASQSCRFLRGAGAGALVGAVPLAALLVLRAVSTAVYKRFPTTDHLVEAGASLPPCCDLIRAR